MQMLFTVKCAQCMSTNGPKKKMLGGQKFAFILIFYFGFETPKDTSVGRNNSSGVLTMSICSSSLRNCVKIKVWWSGGRRRTFFGLFGIAVKWPWHGLCDYFISICSFCRGQHTDVNIWSIPLFFCFSGVAKNRPKSLYISLLLVAWLASLSSWLKCYCIV